MRSICFVGLTAEEVQYDFDSYLQGKKIIWQQGPTAVDFHEYRKSNAVVQPASVGSFGAHAPNQPLFVMHALYKA